MNWNNKEEFSNYIYNNYKHANFERRNINLFNIPIEYNSFTDEIENQKFSDIYKFLFNNYETKIVETNSKGISLLRQCTRNNYQQLVRVGKTQIEIIFTIWSWEIHENCIQNNFGEYIYCRFVISIGLKYKKESFMNGRLAYNILMSEFKKHDININNYITEFGENVKCNIEAPVIELGKDCILDETYENAHHLDFNSAFTSGIITEYPELTDMYTELYNKRHEKNGLYKDVLNMSIGYMQSEYCIIDGNKFALAKLSKAAVNWTAREIRKKAKQIAKTGRKILLFNTDGIWYQGDIYHDKNEGTNLCQWKNDHKNCKLRIKSKGAYEFIENNKYTPVYRGTSSYEKVKPREKFEWGDIYKGEVLEYKWVEGIGLCKK